MIVRQKSALTSGRKVAVLAMPWVFLALLAGVYGLVLVPRVHSISIVVVCIGFFLGMTVLCFAVAAFTFSRDVLSGHYRA